LSTVVSSGTPATAQAVGTHLATASYVTVNSHTKVRIKPRSSLGVLLIATEKCSLLIDGQIANMEAGDHKRVRKPQEVELPKTAAISAHLVLVQVDKQAQPLSFEKFTLAGHQELEDGSDENDTLIVALSDVRLRTVKNLGTESEWLPGPPQMITLKRGETYWQAPGTYHFRNTSAEPANFLMVEW
jgi:hypothetical protein